MLRHNIRDDDDGRKSGKVDENGKMGRNVLKLSQRATRATRAPRGWLLFLPALTMVTRKYFWT